MLHGAAPDHLVELRWKPPGEAMRSEFHPAGEWDRIEAAILSHSRQGDCYIGVLPRKRTSPQTGGREACGQAHVLWVDCDTPEAVARLRAFQPTPAVVVRSGSGGVHAYWPLWPPIQPDDAVRGNRRLAHHLGADMKATDAPRILRPPGSLNWKHQPPKPVTAARLQPDVFDARAVAGHLTDPPIERRQVAKVVNPNDPLEQIPAETYFHLLAGLEPDRTGKVKCPIPDHPDRTPSCHLYERDWTCYGCGRGGTIYHLAGHLWGLEPRGDGFKEIRRRLQAELGVAA